MNVRSSAKKLHTTYRKGYSAAMAMRYRVLESRQSIIVIVGDQGVATAREYLTSILRANGDVVASITSGETGFRRTSRDFYEQMSLLKKSSARYVIIELTPSLCSVLQHTKLEIDTIIATTWSDMAQNTVQQLVCRRLVLPYGAQMGDTEVVGQHNLMTFGDTEEADMAVESCTLYKKGTEATIRVDHHDVLEIATYLIGAHNVILAAAALCAAYLLGVDKAVFVDGIADVEAVQGNYQQSIDNGHIVVRDEAPTPDTLIAVAKTARELTTRRVLLAYDKEGDESLYHDLKHYVDRIVVVGRNYGIAGVETATFASEAQDIVLRAAKKSDTVILAGASYCAVAGATEEE